MGVSINDPGNFPKRLQRRLDYYKGVINGVKQTGIRSERKNCHTP